VACRVWRLVRRGEEEREVTLQDNVYTTLVQGEHDHIRHEQFTPCRLTCYGSATGTTYGYLPRQDCAVHSASGWKELSPTARQCDEKLIKCP
jgi:hypothetical protein